MYIVAETFDWQPACSEEGDFFPASFIIRGHWTLVDRIHHQQAIKNEFIAVNIKKTEREKNGRMQNWKLNRVYALDLNESINT